jgi:glycosyltransferase involved in cell wall biosynthesis
MKRLVFIRKRKLSLLGQVRDPLPKTELSTRSSKKNGTTKFVGIVGTLDERKSIDLAVRAIKVLGVSYQLNLVGQATESFRPELNRLTSNFSRVRVKDKFLTESEMSREIAALDCFLVLQKINIPSGTLLRALDAGIPSVVGGARVLKVAGVEFQDSITWTKLRVGDVAGAIEVAVNSRPRVVSSIPGPSDFAEDLLG